MAPPQKVPDEIQEDFWLRGIGPTRTSEELLEMGYQITPAGVSDWRRRHGKPMKKPTRFHLALIPWRVKVEHSGHAYLAALQTEARRRAGTPLGSQPRASIQRRARVRAEVIARGYVIDYHQNVGFRMVPARPGIDKDWIREPRILDDGTKIMGPLDWLRD